jgi:hypothetical protein
MDVDYSQGCRAGVAGMLSLNLMVSLGGRLLQVASLSCLWQLLKQGVGGVGTQEGECDIQIFQGIIWKSQGSQWIVSTLPEVPQRCQHRRRDSGKRHRIVR